jgi:hypothetical protein
MANSQISSWATGLLVAGLVVFAGCKGDAPKVATESASAADKATPSEGAAAKVDKATADTPDKSAVQTPKAGEGAAKVASGIPSPRDAKAPTDKATLSKAYVEIYCAQRKKEAERLLEIYTRYGFADPKAWTASWTEAAKDDAWVAEITQKAIQTCP